MTIVVVQARMGSSRLPGKVLRDLGGRRVLSWVLRAAEEAAVGRVVVATTTEAEDDAIARMLEDEPEVSCVRGPVEDVLTRFLQATDGAEAREAVVRLTADCPLLDPALIRLAVDVHEVAEVDYVSTVLERTLPRGEDVEVTNVGVLRDVSRLATGSDRVHVTSALYRAGSSFRTLGLVFQPRADDLRVTLDTASDARLLDEVVAELGDRAPAWAEVVALLRRRPELAQLNADVRHKELSEG